MAELPIGTITFPFTNIEGRTIRTGYESPSRYETSYPRFLNTSVDFETVYIPLKEDASTEATSLNSAHYVDRA